MNVLGLMLIVVHLGYVLATAPVHVRRRWFVASSGALLLLSPLLIATSRQREQVAWLPKPEWSQLTGFLHAEFAATLTVVALLLVAVVGVVRRTQVGGTDVPALALGLTWSLVPPLLLWAISQAHPLFDWRYVFFTVPGTMLALGSLATMLRARWLVAAVLVLALGGMHMQQVYRYLASGHAEDIRGAAMVIKDDAQPGDAVLFLPASRRVVKMAYPDAFAVPDDIALARSGPDSATLWGVEEPVSQIRKELKHRKRVWVVTGPTRFGEAQDKVDSQKGHLIDDGFQLVGEVSSHGYEVRLYVRATGDAPALPTDQALKHIA
jgi:mannosyltransferase